MNLTKGIRVVLKYLFLISFGLLLAYPLIWLLFASFKADNLEIFGSMNLLPSHWTLDGYLNGWKGSGQYDFGRFFLNTVTLVGLTVAATVLGTTLVAYGFARFRFPFRDVLFGLMIATLMLPGAVIIIPRYILFNQLGWIDSYLPFIVPALFATNAFFVFMMVQFFRGIPLELDESAKMDGCGPVRIFLSILVPLTKPAIVSMTIFQFIWTWNDFFNSTIFINSVGKYTLQLALRMSNDAAAMTAWNQILAMSMLTILPCIVIFFLAQKHFVDGITAGGVKG